MTSPERFDDEVMGTKFEEHWYNPRGIGNGPYRFVRFERGVMVELERDPWFPLGGNAVDRIEIAVVQDSSKHPLMLQSAESIGKGNNEGVPSSLASQQFRQVLEEGGDDSPRAAPSNTTFLDLRLRIYRLNEQTVSPTKGFAGR